jgi:hypothetical protein
MPREPNMILKKLFKTRMQVFVAIAWLFIFIVITSQMYPEVAQAWKTSSTSLDGIIVTYLQMMALTTGVCLLAWGVPFVPGIGYRLFSGQPPLEPLEVGGREKDPLNINPWLAAFIAGSFFLFWVGAIWGEPYYVGGLCAVGLWGILLMCVPSVVRMGRRKKP